MYGFCKYCELRNHRRMSRAKSFNGVSLWYFSALWWCGIVGSVADRGDLGDFRPPPQSLEQPPTAASYLWVVCLPCEVSVWSFRESMGNAKIDKLGQTALGIDGPVLCRWLAWMVRGHFLMLTECTTDCVWFWVQSKHF